MRARGVVAGAIMLTLAPALARPQAARSPLDASRRLAPPVLSSVTQTPGAIWPQIWFQVPEGTIAIRVSRRSSGGTWAAITPVAVPLSSVPTPTGRYYYWTDDTLGALGDYYYTVTSVLGDGRMVTSAAIEYSPAIHEATSLHVAKPNGTTAVITFEPGRWPAQSYTLSGAGLPATGVAAVARGVTRSTWSVTVGNLAAGRYRWTLQALYTPGVRTSGVPIAVTVP